MKYKFYINSTTAWEAMREAISGATETIYWESYIFIDDVETYRFFDLLKDFQRFQLFEAFLLEETELEMVLGLVVFLVEWYLWFFDSGRL